MSSKPWKCRDGSWGIKEGYRCVFGDRGGARKPSGKPPGGGSKRDDNYSSYYAFAYQQQQANELSEEEERIQSVLLCALFCIIQIQRQGLEFPCTSSFNPPVPDEDIETTSSDEHEVDLVEGVAETISTSSSDLVVGVESSSNASVHVEVDLPETSLDSSPSIISKLGKLLLYESSPPKTSHLTTSKVSITSIGATLLLIAHTASAAGSGDSSNVGSALPAFGAVAVLAGQMYSSSKSSSKKRVFKDITNRVGVQDELDDSDSDDGELIETELVVFPRIKSLPSSSIPNVVRGYTLDKSSNNIPSVDEQKPASFPRSKCTNDETEEGEIQLGDSSVKPLHSSNLSPAGRSRGYTLDKPKSSTNFSGDTPSVDEQKHAASPKSKCNNDEMEEGEVRENIPSFLYDIAKSKYESSIRLGHTTDVAFVCTVNSLKKDKRVEIIPPNSPEAIVFDVVLANADLTDMQKADVSRSLYSIRAGGRIVRKELEDYVQAVRNLELYNLPEIKQQIGQWSSRDEHALSVKADCNRLLAGEKKGSIYKTQEEVLREIPLQPSHERRALEVLKTDDTNLNFVQKQHKDFLNMTAANATDPATYKEASDRWLIETGRGMEARLTGSGVKPQLGGGLGDHNLFNWGHYSTFLCANDVPNILDADGKPTGFWGYDKQPYSLSNPNNSCVAQAQKHFYNKVRRNVLRQVGVEGNIDGVVLPCVFGDAYTFSANVPPASMKNRDEREAFVEQQKVETYAKLETDRIDAEILSACLLMRHGVHHQLRTNEPLLVQPFSPHVVKILRCARHHYSNPQPVVTRALYIQPTTVHMNNNFSHKFWENYKYDTITKCDEITTDTYTRAGLFADFENQALLQGIISTAYRTIATNTQDFVDALVKSLVLRSKSHKSVPLLEITGFPYQTEGWIHRNKEKLLDHHDLDDKDDLRILHALSFLGSNGGENSVKAQCEKLNCTTKELMKKKLETGAANSDRTVEDILRVGGENSVKAQCEKLNCTTKELMKKKLETGAANSDRTVEDILRVGGENSVKAQCEKLNSTTKELMKKKLEKGAENLGCSVEDILRKRRRRVNPTKKPSLVKGIDFSKTGLWQAPSGNWTVKFRYQDSLRWIGTFATKEKAALANEAARKYLDRTRNDKLTVREIETNTTQAIAVAQEAVEDEKSDSD